MIAPRPVFVLGKHRSGTTWLANQLSGHPRIAGVQHEAHFGIHESAFFERVAGRYGDLRVRANFVEFVRVVSASDYFRLAGATEEFLYGLWPTSYEHAFREVMDRFARERSADWWLEKSPGHTPKVEMLHRLYSDARFIGIIRDPTAVATSVMARSMANPGAAQDPGARARRIVRVLVSWSHYNRAMTMFASRSPAMRIVTYDRLRRCNIEVLQELCAHLDLPFDMTMTENPYRRETSITSEQHRHEILTDNERRLVRATTAVLSLVPSPTFRMTERLALGIVGRRPLPVWFFRLLDEAPPEIP